MIACTLNASKGPEGSREGAVETERVTERVTEKAGTAPAAILSVVRATSTAAGPEPEPLDRVEAQAMIDAACWLKCRARRLPDDSALRSRWLAVAEEYRTAARLLWPSLGRHELAAPPVAR